MITVIIADNNLQDRKALKKLLEDSSIPVEVLASFSDSKEAEQSFNAFDPDLIFISIAGKQTISATLYATLWDKMRHATIFTSRNVTISLALKILRQGAHDLLSKPLNKTELEQSLARFVRNKEQQVASWPKNIWISKLDSKIRIDTDNIMYCASINSYTDFHLHKSINKVNTQRSSVSIGLWEQTLSNTSICRIHNRYMVNLAYVNKYISHGNGAVVMLKNGVELPVSRSRKEELKKRMQLHQIRS